MKLFIIGNGFDKGHGLNTSYWDFRTYLKNMYPEFLYAFESHYYIYPANYEEAQKNLLWNELENRYVYKLSRVSNKNIDEIYVIGHSVAEVDLPYFRYIENCTHRQSNWIVYFFNKEEKDRTYKNLMDSGIQKSRIQMKEASEFYNL